MCTRPNPTRRALVPVLLVLASPALPAQTIHVWTGVGERPAAAGDVDADGYDDVVVGGIGPNVARVLSGRDGSLLWTLSPTAPSADFGATVAGVGDVDADGHDDVLVAGPGTNGTSVEPSVIVFSGKDASVLHAYGIELGLWGLGASAAGLGDVDGDGHDDFAVGAMNLGPRAVLVVSGAGGEVLYRVPEGSVRVANAGDADGDGLDDFLASEVGVQLRSGRDGRLIRDYLYPQGHAAAVAGLGDLDGDGHGDLAIASYSGLDVHSGRSGDVLFELPGPFSGVAGVGDQDEDGVPDLLLVHGSGSRLASGVDGATIASLPGALAGAAAGDLNADGRPDYLLAHAAASGVTVVAQSLGRIPYCDPAVRNSTGRAASIEATGSLAIDAHDFGLAARGLVPDGLGVFLVARQRGWLPHPGGSDGVLCLGAPIGAFRSLAARAGASGALAVAVDLVSLPAVGALLPGESLHFQCWYRDGASSNLSDAVKTYFR